MTATITLSPMNADADVIVVGGSTGAVACAITAARGGRKTLLAAPRSYLGDDICATLRLWRPQTTSEHPLVRAIWPIADAASMPLHIKRTLEEEALAAGVELILETAPAGLIRDAGHRVCGVLLATRSGLLAVSAGAIVDATRTAAVARQMGLAGVQRFNPVQVDVERICAGDACESASILSCEFPVPNPEGFDIRLSAYAIAGSCPLSGSDPQSILDFEASAKLAVYDTEPTIMADDAHWVPPAAMACGIPPTPVIDTTTESIARSLAHAEGALWILGPCAVGGAYAAQFDNPSILIDIGSAVGAMLVQRTASMTRPCTGKIGWAGEACAGVRFANDQARNANRVPAGVAISGDFPILAEVDVLVVGGGTAGSPAAIAAAREGMKTLVIERGYGLGGVGTLGQIASYYYGNRAGFTAEVDAAVHSFGRQPRPNTSLGVTWDVGWKARWWHEETARSGGRVWFGVTCVGVQMDEERVVGVVVACEHGAGLVRARTVVDATGAAEIAYQAGAPTESVGADHLAVQGTGLADVQPGRNYRNSDHSFCDDSDFVDVTRMFVVTRSKCGHAWDVGQLIDSRERRRIAGMYEMTPLDILADRSFPDAIARATSNFDSHGYTTHPLFLILPPDKRQLWAWVPYRCLLPQRIDGVLVTGLGMSAHRDALPVIRMQADVQNIGYVAGIASAMAVAGGTTVANLNISALQHRLVERKMLDSGGLNASDSFPIDELTRQWAATDGLVTHKGVAIVLADYTPGVQEHLRLTLKEGSNSAREIAALVLSMHGDHLGGSFIRNVLCEEVAWDDGWNFRGMGQFGRSMSRIDSLLVAFSHACTEGDVTCIERFCGLLDETASLSHVRSVTWSSVVMGRRYPAIRPILAKTLKRLLHLPGMRGHHQESLGDGLSAARRHPSLIENVTRNNALKELIIASAIRVCDEQDEGSGEVLTRYANDIRGCFSRYAARTARQQAAVEPVSVGL